MIAGQNWRYSPLMTLNNGNSTPGCGSGAALRAADVDDRGLRNRAPNEATGGRTQAHRDGERSSGSLNTRWRVERSTIFSRPARAGGRMRVGALVAGPTARQGARRARCASGGPGGGVGAQMRGALREAAFGPRLRGRSLFRPALRAQTVIADEYVESATVRDPDDLDFVSYDFGIRDCQTFAPSSGKLDFP